VAGMNNDLIVKTLFFLAIFLWKSMM